MGVFTLALVGYAMIIVPSHIQRALVEKLLIVLNMLSCLNILI